MGKTTVYVRHLESPHQTESLTKFQPLNKALAEEAAKVVYEIFDAAGGASMLKSSKEVFIKPNGIDGQPYCFTRPEVLEAAINYWYEHGAKKVYLFENSTQCNATRLVYAITGYDKVCKRTGAIPVYLDEDKNVEFEFKGRDDYMCTKLPMPKFVVKNLIKNKDKNLYITIPKLKTHSMAGVTMGVKNQWAFPQQYYRGYDHNYALASKLIDVFSYVRPDFCLLEGIEGTIYGHYPVTALADEAECLDDIDIDGDISMYNTKYPTDLYDCYPEDVTVIKGKEMCCKQGCQNNPLTLLQIMYKDHGGTGGWTLIMGKGFDPEEIDAIEGQVLICGDCAIDEVGDRLIKRLGKKNVFLSHTCNRLADTFAGMAYLMHVNPLEFAPINPIKSVKCLALLKLHGSKALVPSTLSHVIKKV